MNTVVSDTYGEIGVMIALGLLVLFAINAHEFAPSPDRYLSQNPQKLLSSESVQQNCKTLDLIFLSGKTPGEGWIRLLSGSVFSHVAIVIRDVDEPYLWESDYGQGSRIGTRSIPFRLKIERWKGCKIGAWMKYKGDNTLTVEQIYRVIKDKFDVKFDDLFASYLIGIKRDGDMFCSETVMQLLTDVGVTTPNVVPYWYAPRHFFERSLNTEPSLRELYDEPILFTAI